MRRCGPAIALVFLALALPVGAQEGPVHLRFHGPEFFCHILFAKGLTPIDSVEEAQKDPGDTLVIVFGNPHAPAVRDFWTGDMKRFLDNGGNLMLATDQRMSIPDLSVKVLDSRKISENAGYREDPRCPLLTYVDPRLPGSGDARAHPLFQMLNTGIASNCPSEIGGLDRRLPSLLNFQHVEGDLVVHPYMVGSPKGAPPHGHALVIAGHGMFMNGIMLQRDNDNFAFSVNAIQWLREAPQGQKRSKALFVVDGQIITDFDMNLTPPPPKLPMPTVAMLNRLIRGLEDEDFFHKVLRGLLGDRFQRVAPFLLALATGVLLVYGGKKFLDGRAFRDHAVPRTVGTLPPNSAAARVAQQQEALNRQQDASTDARRLGLNWFESELGIEPPQWSAGIVASFLASGSFLTRGPLQRQADFLLSLVQGGAPVNVSRAEFARLVQSLPELSRALQDGRLALLLNGKEVRHLAQPEA